VQENAPRQSDSALAQDHQGLVTVLSISRTITTDGQSVGEIAFRLQYWVVAGTYG